VGLTRFFRERENHQGTKTPRKNRGKMSFQFQVGSFKVVREKCGEADFRDDGGDFS
jgi:hypothetical protein